MVFPFQRSLGFKPDARKLFHFNSETKVVQAIAADAYAFVIPPDVLVVAFGGGGGGKPRSEPVGARQRVVQPSVGAIVWREA